MFKDLLDKFRKNKLPPVLVPQLMDTYARQPVSFVRGEGTRLWDQDGNEYLDAAAGGGVTVLGHSHPQINQAISLQAGKLLHVGNQVHIQEQAQLAERLCAIAEQEKAYFCESGEAAKLAALQLLARFSKKQSVGPAKVLSLTQASRNLVSVDGIEIHTIGFDDLDAIGAFATDEAVVAVMLPAIHCTDGVQYCSSGYLSAVRDLCNEHNWLLIADERLSGMGRTGTWFAYQQAQVSPDMVIVSEALANGLSVGALCARGEIARFAEPGDLDSLCGGNPLVSQVALTVIDTIENEQLLAIAQERGEYLRRKIQHHIGTFNGVVDIRGNGLLLVIELEQARPEIATKFLLQGLVVDVFAEGRYVRFSPPINLSQEHAAQIAAKVHDVLVAL